MSVATVYRALEVMGYRYRRLRHDLTPRQDAEATASTNSTKHVLAEFQKRGAAARAGFRLIYVDECDLHSPPGAGLAAAWMPHERASAGPVFGAVDYASGQVVWEIRARKHGAAFAAFLAHLGQTWPEELLILVMDNESHHRSPVVREWWAGQAGRITPLWLPVYTLNLNLMDRIWRLLKQKLACNCFWADVTGLEAAARTLLDHLRARFYADDTPSLRMLNNLREAA